METRHRFIVGSAARLGDFRRDAVDLIVTSPPYPMIEMWDATFAAQDPEIAAHIERGEGPEAFERMHQVLDAVWAECFRVLRPGGFACINIGDATRSIGGSFRLFTNHARIVTRCEALGFQTLPTVLWRKQTNAPNKFMGSGMLPSGAYVTLEHEHVLILRKGGNRTFGPDEKVRRTKSAFFWEERNTWFSDIWDLKGVQQRLAPDDARARSGAFPFELPFRLISMYSMQEDLVLDPFVGTGTTILAAIAAGRSSIGVEIDPALTPAVLRAVESGSSRINERQLRRLRDHDEFVRVFRETRGQEPGHTNVPYDVPVVTRQETGLVLAGVTDVRLVAERDDGVDWEASHEPLFDRGELQPELF
jgi:modification methylase